MASLPLNYGYTNLKKAGEKPMEIILEPIFNIVKWLTRKLNREQLWNIIFILLGVLHDQYDDIKPRNDFLDKHPNYRKFLVDPLAPLNHSEIVHEELPLNYKVLLIEYITEHGKPLKPVNIRNKNNQVSKTIICIHCEAPAEYLYYNDGKKRSQILCKVCNNTSTPNKRHKNKPKYVCPYCHKNLFLWKEQDYATIYKCGNDKCPHRIRELEKLNDKEKELRKTNPEHFKINYQYREYHYKIGELKTASPDDKPTVDIHKIHNDFYTFCLVLTLHISYAITARKTAHMLKNVFGINISHQTVLNYIETAAYHLHKFNQSHKQQLDGIIAGDETYVKQQGIWHYIWLIINSKTREIVGYDYSDNRGVKPAIAVMLNAINTEIKDKKNMLVIDGNPSYQAAAHFINQLLGKDTIILKKVIGLKNLDDESAEYREHKQIIERLNRTFKYHTQSQNGFASRNGAISKLVCFVTYYNFIRPHSSLNYKVPVELDELSNIDLIQDKWKKILSMAA